MFLPTIGLEIHIELKTKSKMFCSCLNDPLSLDDSKGKGKTPNVNVCPVCLAHPGVLPTINKEAVEAVLKVGLALSSEIPKFSKFDRKNYFYPDLPKGYQISQYDKPLCIGGELKGVKITRIHLEEDTARLLHMAKSEEQMESTLVDFNRAGVPLMELVTEPDIKSAEEALDFAKELQLILKYLGVSEADMEKGQMRVEVNISIRPNDSGDTLGTKVEIKNLNSFRAVGESIKYEIERQIELLEKGEKIVQETRGWDDVKKITVSQRTKEEAHDYRYFPEPDLPPLDLSKFDLGKLQFEIPELPAQKRARFMKEYGLNQKQVEVLVSDRFAGQFLKKPFPNYKLQTINYKLFYIII